MGRKSKSLAKRNVALTNPGGISLGTIAIIAIVGFVIYLFLKSRASVGVGSYLNEESWNVEYNKDGMPTRITIHRDAKRS